MKKLLFGLSCVWFLAGSAFAVEQAALVSPQYFMVGARLHSLGGAPVTLTQDINGIFVNPAAVSDTDSLQLMLGHQSVLGEFDYKSFAVSLPFRGAVLSLSYGSDILYGIPTTSYYNDTIYSTGTYSSGFSVLSFGTSFTQYMNFLWLSRLSYGINVKMLQQTLGSSSRNSYGIDVGAVGLLNLDYDWATWLDDISLGASVLNGVATDLPEWRDSPGTNPIQRQIFLGMQMSMFNKQWDVFGNLQMSDQIDSYSIGVERHLGDMIDIRGSMVLPQYDSSLNSYYNLGVGLLMKDVGFFSFNTYNMRLDYNMQMLGGVLEGDTTHTLGLSILGESRDPRPRIVSPQENTVSKIDHVDLEGMGMRNSIVYLYHNDQEVGSVNVDRFGHWKYLGFRLKEGNNLLYVKSKAQNATQYSYRSNELVLLRDTQSPEVDFQFKYLPVEEMLLVDLKSSEPVSSVYANLDGVRVRFDKRGEQQYQTKLSMPERLRDSAFLPETMATLSVTVEDLHGNETATDEIPFYVSLKFPNDKTVLYSDRITAMGKVSEHVASIRLNNQKVEISPKNTIMHALYLNNGKNTLQVDIETKTGERIRYYARLLHMKRFADIPTYFEGKSDIEMLASMGYMDAKSDGRFYPNDNLSRVELAEFLVNFKRLTTETLSYAPFLDVPINHPKGKVILAAVNEGLMIAYPDGTFKPDQAVSREDAFKALVNNGIIDSDQIVVDARPINRANFALMLKDIDRYQERVQYLLNWDKGYNVPKRDQ